MKDNTLYMFIDEGGNFDFSPNGTKYFTLSCLTEKRPFPSYDKLRNIKYDLIEDGINIEYFHASTDKQFVRDMVSSVIQDNIDNIKVDSMIVQKNKTHPALYPEEKFYSKVFGMLMKWVLRERVDLQEIKSLIIFTDNMPLNKKKKAMEKAVKLTLSGLVKEGLQYNIYHHQSKSNLNLQVVDYLNWSIFRKWERGDARSYEIIKKAVDAEWDVFRHGDTIHYDYKE
ncbi:MAG: DUF3800 domain-containing protein [Candidatus Scalindua sp.]|jgi:hypothetical protein|nr:DUF3800 domain-containing protein [Candidatus Scalindua sp.]